MCKSHVTILCNLKEKYHFDNFENMTHFDLWPFLDGVVWQGHHYLFKALIIVYKMTYLFWN